MDTKEIAKIKLDCLEQAKFQCQNNPQNLIEVAKTIYEWVVSIQ